MADKLVTIAEFNNAMEANMARLELEAGGIRAEVEGDLLPYSGVAGRLAVCEVKVLQSDAQAAAKIIEDYIDRTKGGEIE